MLTSSFQTIQTQLHCHNDVVHKYKKWANLHQKTTVHHCNCNIFITLQNQLRKDSVKSFCNPVDVHGNVGVHPRKMLPCTSNPPTNKTDHLEPPVDWQHERASAVALTTVTTTVLVTGAQEVLRVDLFLPMSGLEPGLTFLGRNNLDLHLLEQ